jgi:hypothetical protein
MNARLARSFFLLGLVTAAGCGDTADTILRSGANSRSELTDRLMKVTDEASGKKFIDYHLKNYTEKSKALDEKWLKWIKDIEDDYGRGKKKVIAFTTTGAPGTEQWEKDARNVPANEDERVVETREAFITYMKKITADTARFERERARIGDIVNYLVAEETAKGGERTSAKEICPSLVKITEPNTFRGLLLSGAEKKQP